MVIFFITAFVPEPGRHATGMWKTPVHSLTTGFFNAQHLKTRERI